MIETLRHSWERAWAGLGADGDGRPLRDDLLKRYSEPQRAYHTLQHLEECLRAFETIAPFVQNPAEVETALWFHDAIYDVHASDNEEKSAELAESALLRAHVADDVVTHVRELILATKHASVPGTLDGQVLVDIDLSILGAGAARFDEYERQIRQEYAWVPDELFRERRGAILQGFLARPRIYSTEHFYCLLEDSARENLRRLLQGYGQPMTR